MKFRRPYTDTFSGVCYSRGRIRLSSGGRKVGTVVFTNLTEDEEGYDCQPKGILTPEEAKQLSAQLRQLPPVRRGMIGEYLWEENFDRD